MSFRSFSPKPRMLLWVPILLLGTVPLLWVDAYQLSVWTFILLSLIVVLGLDVLLGYGGQLSLGHGVFVAVGAYSTALLTTKAGWSGWLAMPCGMAVAASLAVLVGVPTLRLRGYYLAMATLGFPVVLDGVLRHASAWTGGSSGIAGVPPITLGSFALRDPTHFYWFALGVVCVVFYITDQLVRSRLGLALMAVHADEAAAAARGINVARTKVVAFVFSAVVASLSGSLYAHYVQFVAPDTFGISYSIMLIVMLVVGGAGRLWGAVIGTVAMMWLPEMLRATSTFEPVVYGLILAIVLLFAPLGIAGLIRRQATIPFASVRRATSSGTHSPTVRHGSDSHGPLLTLQGVSKQFGGVRAVNSLSCNVSAGSLQAMIGPNGAGKSTVLALVAGTLPPSTGEIRFGGRRVDSLPAHSRARLGIGRTFQHIRLITGLTVLENVVIGGHGAPGDSATQTHELAVGLLHRLGLAGVADMYPSEINQFQCRLTEIAAALAGRPRLLLLDEPGAGLSSVEIGQLVRLLRSLREGGVSVVLVDHVMPLVMASADRILVLEHGTLIAEGAPDEVVRNEQVRAAYLGRSAAVQSDPTADTAGTLVAAGAAGSKRTMPLLQATNLSLRFGSNVALDNVSLNVADGEFVALVGANGAGKSSLLKALVGLEPVFAGRVNFRDVEITKLAAYSRVASGIALVPEGRGVFRDMSVSENLALGSYLRSGARHRGEVAADLARVLELFPRLAERRAQIAGTLSGGEQQMLAIGRALMTNPQLLVLDEPSLGLAPRVVEEIVEALKQLNAERGLSILVAEQNAVLGLGMAQRGYVLNGGRVVLQGVAAELAQQGELIDSYLGSSMNDNERKVA